MNTPTNETHSLSAVYDDLADSFRESLAAGKTIIASIPVSIQNENLNAAHTLGATPTLGVEFCYMGKMPAEEVRRLIEQVVDRWERDYQLQHSFHDYRSRVFTLPARLGRKHHVELREIVVSMESKELLFPVLQRYNFDFPNVRMIQIVLVTDNADRRELTGQLILRK